MKYSNMKNNETFKYAVGFLHIRWTSPDHTKMTLHMIECISKKKNCSRNDNLQSRSAMIISRLRCSRFCEQT